jgi:hypothetical protein
MFGTFRQGESIKSRNSATVRRKGHLIRKGDRFEDWAYSQDGILSGTMSKKVSFILLQ